MIYYVIWSTQNTDYPRKQETLELVAIHNVFGLNKHKFDALLCLRRTAFLYFMLHFYTLCLICIAKEKTEVSIARMFNLTGTNLLDSV